MPHFPLFVRAGTFGEMGSHLRAASFSAVRSYRLNKRLSFRAAVGVEPPIDAHGDRMGGDNERRVSPRWLAGVSLTGLIGGGLLGGALFAAFDRDAYFAAMPTRAILARHEPVEDSGVNPKKGDRLLKSVDIVAARQSFKAPTLVRVGDRDVTRTHLFTKVSTTLTLAETGLASEVPEYNANKTLAGANAAPETDNEPDAAPVEEVNPDLTAAVSDLSSTAPSEASAALSADEAKAQAIETLRAVQAAGARAALALPSQLLLMHTSRAGLDFGGPSAAGPAGGNINAPFSAIEVRMVPENITVAPRNTTPNAEGAAAAPENERLITVHKGETLDEILADAGVGADAIAQARAAFRAARGDLLGEGRRIKLSFADTERDNEKALARISFYDGDDLKASALLGDDGHYQWRANAPVAPKPVKAASADDESDDETDDDGGAMRLYNSVYETGLKQDIPKPIIDQMIVVFGNDVDFQRGVSAGDSIEAFYDHGEDPDGGRAELLYASITSRGETFHYYRFQSPSDQSVDFFDPLGRSTRKFLLRKPIASGEFRSGFGMRFHPILHYSRPHNGVDWGAPIGTPIFAAGDGVVLKAAWDAGYGRRVEIEHPNGYVTTYNHMSRFGRGMAEGVHVSQGQVVGYLGASGLATGPHLHYEVIVNGHYVDPMRVKLARTRQVENNALPQFKRERDRIDGLMALAPNANYAAK